MPKRAISAVILLIIAGFCVWFFLLKPGSGPIKVKTTHYVCTNKDCGYEFELNKPFTTAELWVVCPKCKKKKALKTTTYCETCQKYIPATKLKVVKVKTASGKTAMAVQCTICKHLLSFKTKAATTKK